MNWQFTLSLAVAVPAFAVFCKHICAGKDRSWHAFYGALLAMVPGCFGLLSATGNDYSNIPPIILIMMAWSFGLAGFLGAYWAQLSKRSRSDDTAGEANKGFEKLRFLGILVYIIWLFPFYGWHNAVLPGLTILSLGFLFLFAGLVSGALLYRGKYGFLTLMGFLAAFLLIAIGSNTDPALLKECYIPLGMILMSAAVLIGMLPATPLELWRQFHGKSQ